MAKIKKPAAVVRFIKNVSGPPLPDVGPEMRQTIQDERIRRQKFAHIMSDGGKKKKGR